MIILIIVVFNTIATYEYCTIDRCEGNFCPVETLECVVDIHREAKYREGMSIKCP